MIIFVLLIFLVIVGLVSFGLWRFLNWNHLRLRREPSEVQRDRVDREFSISGDNALVIPRQTTLSRDEIAALGQAHGFEYSHATGNRFAPVGMAFKRVAPDPIPNRYPTPPKVAMVKPRFGGWRQLPPDNRSN